LDSDYHIMAPELEHGRRRVKWIMGALDSIFALEIMGGSARNYSMVSNG